MVGSHWNRLAVPASAGALCVTPAAAQSNPCGSTGLQPEFETPPTITLTPQDSWDTI
jgi:hypothetical protein